MNKNTEFIFIRHGITELNVKKVYFGQLDAPLINEGIQQIQNTKKKRVDNLSIRGLGNYSSSLLEKVRILYLYFGIVSYNCC